MSFVGLCLDLHKKMVWWLVRDVLELVWGDLLELHNMLDTFHLHLLVMFRSVSFVSLALQCVYHNFFKLSDWSHSVKCVVVKTELLHNSHTTAAVPKLELTTGVMTTVKSAQFAAEKGNSSNFSKSWCCPICFPSCFPMFFFVFLYVLYVHQSTRRVPTLGGSSLPKLGPPCPSPASWPGFPKRAIEITRRQLAESKRMSCYNKCIVTS